MITLNLEREYLTEKLEALEQIIFQVLLKQLIIQVIIILV